jgi:MFS family permease
MITKKIGQGKTVGVMAGGICIGTLLLAFTSSPAASIMLIAMVGLCAAMILPISADIQNKSISTSDRATILSAYAMTIDIVSAFTNLAIGKTANQSIQLSFLACSVLAAAALLISYYYFRRANKLHCSIS